MRRDMRTADRHDRRSHRPLPLGRAGRWAAALSTGLLCSCAGTGGNPFAMTPAAPSPEGVARVSAAPEFGGVRQVHHVETVGAEEDVRHADAHFSPAEPRMPLTPADYHAAPCPPGCPPYGVGAATGLVPASAGPLGYATPRPDEFLCDGGDRNPPVHYDRTFRHGLDTEDTVGEWTDPAGNHHVTPSNKVCVYAPRYGEVRSFSTPVGGTKVDRLVSANEFRRGLGLNAETSVETEVQKTRLEGTRVRSRASGLETEHALSGFENATAAALNLEDVPPIVGTGFLQRGVMTRGEEAFLAKGVRAAVVWTRTQYPVVTAVDVSAHEVRAEFRPSEIVGLEDMNKPGSLRVVKLADKSAAAPGEVVTFTIRYDNVGDKPVHHVRVVDNLTPRLELVEGSATSDRAGRLDVEPNGEGSYVLTFVIDDPLPGKTGGTVTFRARVK
ncbi:MAG TPA: hypothetical protein VF170_20590 [Planctomycetaceae bacterium]